MSTPGNKRLHGGVRGANLSRSSLLFGGPFGRIFRALPPADFGDTESTTLKNLAKLADAMNGPADPAKDGPDAEESGIPAGYTYFGQFMDHDLTFDPASSLQKQDDPDALVDYRTPRFDLDNIYGRGPDDQPYLYADDGKSFLRGKPLTGAARNPNATDLPRSTDHSSKTGGRAIIGDPRNDENIIVSQLQGLLHRFHNKVVKDHDGKDGRPKWDFPRIQQEVRFHYQWIVLHDFLPHVVDHTVLRKVVVNDGAGKEPLQINLRYFHPKNEAFMPMEFSVAAYRFGHSMVRPGYRLNENKKPLPLFALDPAPDMRGLQPPPEDGAIDWRHFVDLEPMDYGTLVDKPNQHDFKNQNRMQLAYRMDTSLVNPLSLLPKREAVNPHILALRNLERGWRMRLPSGQDVARAMAVDVLPDSEIWIGQFTDEADPNLKKIDKIADGAFKDNCPLWTYVLAETRKFITHLSVETLEGTKKISTPKLGEVGGTIVAETIAGLLLADSSSFVSLDPRWKPNPLYASRNGAFRLRDLIRVALND